MLFAKNEGCDFFWLIFLADFFRKLKFAGISIFCEVSSIHKLIICKESVTGEQIGNVTSAMAA